MNILHQLNSIPIYIICGSIIAFVAALCIIFMVRGLSRRACHRMDKAKMKRVITSSATFSLLPSVGILLVSSPLAGSPGYAVAVASAVGHWRPSLRNPGSAGRGRTGRHGGVVGEPDDGLPAFSTIALLMSICIMWGMILSVLFNKNT